MTKKRATLSLCLLFLLWPSASTLAEPDAPAAEAKQDAPAAETQPGAIPEARTARYLSGPDRRDQALVRQNPDSVRWLEAAGGRFPVLQTASLRPDSLGTVIVLADAGQMPTQGLAGRLHPELAALGWQVMGLGLPPLPLPARVDTPAPAPATDSATDSEAAAAAEPSADSSSREETGITIDLAAPEPSVGDAEQYALQAQSRIAAVMAVVEEGPPGLRVLVGIGQAAEPLTRYLLDQQSRRVALVWVLPQFPPADPGASPAPPLSWLEDGRPWPILDITDSRQHRQQAAARRVALQQLAGDAAYRQDALMLAPLTGDAAPQLGRRLHSWALGQLQ